MFEWLTRELIGTLRYADCGLRTTEGRCLGLGRETTIVGSPRSHHRELTTVSSRKKRLRSRQKRQRWERKVGEKTIYSVKMKRIIVSVSFFHFNLEPISICSGMIFVLSKEFGRII